MEVQLLELVKQALKGDREALNQILDKKKSEVLYIAYQYTNNTQDAEDCAQEALLQMFQNISALKRPEYFNTWVYTIVKNLCMDKSRSSKVRRKIAEVVSYDADDDTVQELPSEQRLEFLPEAYALDREKRDTVLDAIKTLPKNYQECLFLYYYQDLSYQSISKVLKVSSKKVDNDLRNAKARLKQYLEKRFQKEYVYSAAPLGVGVLPVLSKIYRMDEQLHMTPDVVNRLGGMVKTASESAGIIAAAGIFHSAAVKTVLVSLLGIGVTGGIFWFAGDDSSPTDQMTHSSIILEDARSASDTVTQTSGVLQTTGAATSTTEEPSTEKPINTLEDMIGISAANLLYQFTEETAGNEAWEEWVAQTGIAKRNLAEDSEHQYVLYLLQKQDKQLIVITRQRKGDSQLDVRYEFGVIQDLFDIAYYLLKF